MIILENKSITMMHGKSLPPEHDNIHVTENYKYNQLRVSLNECLERKFPSKKDFWTFFSTFYTKLAITQSQIIFFEKLKKCFLDRCMRNVIYQFQSSNGQDKPVRQYGRQTGITKNLATFWQKKLL